MDSAQVKKLLQKTFGMPKKSLTVGDDGAAGEWVCFYTLENERQVVSLRELLGMRQPADGLDRLPELRQAIPDVDEKDLPMQQCACLREKDGRWTVYFYRITGVRYHRARDGGVAATLQLDDYPYISLADTPEDFYGFWRKLRSKKRGQEQKREGFSYWMNKALKTSDRFRAFAAAFFRAAEKETADSKILLDAAKAIEACGCFLPPVSLEELLACRTPAELTSRFADGETALPVDFNKVDLNTGYVMAMLAPAVEPASLSKLAKLKAPTVSEAISLKLLYDGFGAEEFVRWYYRKALAGAGEEPELRMYIDDYIRLCADAGAKFRLGMDLKRLIRTHNDLSRELMRRVHREEFALPLVTRPSRFDALDVAIRNTGTAEFERICTTERLCMEGEYQHNCVFSRREMVRADAASIYHWEHGGARYTVQFGLDAKGRFKVTEVRARHNAPISEAHAEDLRRLLEGFCTVKVKAGDEAALPPRRDRQERLGEADLPDGFVFDDDLPF